MLIGSVIAQDISQLQKAKPLVVTGGFSANSSLYQSWGMDSRQDPYFWQLVANINFNFYGVVNMPFSAYYAKENIRYQQPEYMIYGISPRYKSITLHLGYRNMTFSNYSLAGLTFLGAGIEFKPTDFWLSASVMYGRFFKAVSVDSAKNHFKDPSYERWGGGFSVTATGKNKELTLIMFKAVDKLGSIPDPPAETGITPAENFIVGVAGKTQIIQRVTFGVDYTLSAYTSDIRTPKKVFEQYTYLNNLGSLFTSRYSSSFHKALETSIGYQGDNFSTGITYKRIDPGYASLGSTYIENDLEDIVITMSKSFAKNKVNFSGNFGQQRNNLVKDKQTESKRVIGSISMAWTINQMFSVNANYSNHTSSSLPTLINFTDSVKYFQINKNASLNITCNKGNETMRHSAFLMLAVQKATSLNRSATMKIMNDNNMVNTSLSYQTNWLSIGLSTAMSIQSSWFNNDLGTTKNYGPNLLISKNLLKNKIKLSLSYSYNVTKLTENNRSSTHIVRLNNDFQINTHQTLRFQASYMQRKNAEKTGSLSPKELQASLVYQFSF